MAPPNGYARTSDVDNVLAQPVKLEDIVMTNLPRIATLEHRLDAYAGQRSLLEKSIRQTESGSQAVVSLTEVQALSRQLAVLDPHHGLTSMASNPWRFSKPIWQQSICRRRRRRLPRWSSQPRSRSPASSRHRMGSGLLSSSCLPLPKGSTFNSGKRKKKYAGSKTNTIYVHQELYHYRTSNSSTRRRQRP